MCGRTPMYTFCHGTCRSRISLKLKDKHLPKEKKQQLTEFQVKLIAQAEHLGLTLVDTKPLPRVRKRNREVVAKTFHKFGIVVPYDKETEVGYRPLPMTDSMFANVH